MSDQEGFLLDVKSAMFFFRVCSRYKITSLEDRVTLMREMARRKKAKYLRDVSPLLEGKNVLGIGFQPPEELK